MEGSRKMAGCLQIIIFFWGGGHVVYVARSDYTSQYFLFTI